MLCFNHFNFNVLDLDRSLAFYKQALGLTPVREKEAEDKSFKLIYLAFTADDFQAMYEKHKAMGCICFENPAMGIYFISDPDGYWIEIIPTR